MISLNALLGRLVEYYGYPWAIEAASGLLRAAAGLTERMAHLSHAAHTHRSSECCHYFELRRSPVYAILALFLLLAAGHKLRARP